MRKFAIASLFCAATAVFGQTPVPSQLATAHTVFLASAGAPGSGGDEKPIAEMVYTTFYNALSAAHRYQLVDAPATADLSMTIGARSGIDVTNGNSSDRAYLHLEIYDIKTHTLVWAIDEGLQGAYREKTFQHNVDTSVAALIDDLNNLANGKLPGDAATSKSQPTKRSQPTKTRFSNDGK